jgi:hypothetical protein
MLTSDIPPEVERALPEHGWRWSWKKKDPSRVHPAIEDYPVFTVAEKYRYKESSVRLGDYGQKPEATLESSFAKEFEQASTGSMYGDLSAAVKTTADRHMKSERTVQRTPRVQATRRVLQATLAMYAHYDRRCGLDPEVTAERFRISLRQVYKFLEQGNPFEGLSPQEERVLLAMLALSA